MTPPPGAPWLQQAFHEIRRHRHLIIHGNVDDQIRWDGEYSTLPDALERFLVLIGFAGVARYELVSGLTYIDEDSREMFHRIGMPATAGSGHREPEHDRAVPAGNGPIGAGSGSRRERVAASVNTLRDRIRFAQHPNPQTTVDALSAMYPVFTQRSHPFAVLIESPDLIMGQPAQLTDQYPAHVAHIRRLVESAASSVDQTGLRNTLIFITHDLASMPGWLRDSPHVAMVHAEKPQASERRAFLAQQINDYHGTQGLDRPMVERGLDALTNLTDGMTILDLDALRETSRLTRISLAEPRRLVARHRFAMRDDPWEQLDVAKVREAPQRLARRVIGQPEAIQAVSDVLVNARVGIDFVADGTEASSRPKGVFFFVGPTGVGKTELARAIAELVFDDETAMRRFDMSEFSQEHASERLTGAPPGYVGHDEGGVLTNWMLERPFSVVLFDEIEKAHPKIFDKFLQLIDDGRLTDGQGRTVYFSHAIVIFTSNIGAEDLRRISGVPSYPTVQEHFRSAVTRFFTGELGRPELLGRLGNGIVVFDTLREAVIRDIVTKFLNEIAGSARAHGYELVFDRAAIDTAVVVEVMNHGAELGARQIRNPLLERWVRVPLNRWILENAPATGARIWIHRDQSTSSPPFAVGLFPEFSREAP